ncbi:hypothetical protein MARPO_0082s0089 [Marchantia polymorpha]|uniref:Transmembrane protein 135 N-terminal domain-containing protein n=2 Tax=Marchantia polymorpha TaxID=3197 RepID=A0A2R6WK77_MARPO|nr:hypothetical protein MARPO_0082s0089 [Marchantia polymorpha]PTQ34267.1 hypothetical protein MARPO_0082s0089 [Marchantia polymorpha]|eukprot:PTQ34264.1 hypothetical protein MARPO_0082s0089 [Marchantia polymorpha]
MGSCGAAESACSSEGETGLEHDHGDDMLTVPLLNGNSRNLDEPASVLKSRDNPPLDRSMDGLNWNQGGGTRSRAQGCTDDPSRDTDGQGSKIRTNLKDCEDEKLRALERCIAAATKGFVIGAGLRGGLGLFAILSRLRRKKTRSSILQKSNADAVVLALKETLRYGLFLGTFAGGFCSVDEAIATLGGRERTARWRALVAGGVAGPALLLTGHEARHTSMAIYVLMRAAVLAARCGLKSERWGWLCRPLSWKHGDTFLMCLSSSQILTAWILKPDSLPSTYISFLNKHGGKDTSIVHGIRALAQGKGLADQLKNVEQFYRDNGTEVQLSPDMKIPCRIVHGDQGCVPHFFSFLGASYLRSLPVYSPVYFVPAILVHRQGLFARPLTIFRKTLLGLGRSSLFLATYCASAWLWTCGVFRLTQTCNPALVAAGTFPTGLAVLIEKKSRRMELALYCMSRAIESFAICVADTGVLKRWNLSPPKRIDVVLFSMATAIIMQCHAEERDVFRSKYLNVLDWVFGVPDPQKTSLALDTVDEDEAKRKVR